jgi:hypothetical protein
MKNSLASIVLLSLALCGCRTFTDPAREHSVGNGVSWIDYDATRRGAYLISTNNPDVRVLAEQSPDAAMGTVAEFVAKGSYNGISAEASAKVTETIAELGKRTQTVMVLRESMYRLNELQLLRPDMPDSDVKEIYEKILETSLEIAKADLEAAKSESSKAAADKAAADAKKAAEINKTLELLGKKDGLRALQSMGLEK